MKITLDGNQIDLMHHFAGGISDLTFCIEYRENDHSGTGFYIWAEHYPENGSMLLYPFSKRPSHGKRPPLFRILSPDFGEDTPTECPRTEQEGS